MPNRSLANREGRATRHTPGTLEVPAVELNGPFAGEAPKDVGALGLA